MMAETASGRVKTFTIGFAGGREYDEREHARVVAERFGTEHTEFVVEPKALDLDRPARLAPRRAVRRLVGDPDVPPVRADAPPRDGRAERRRRRRGVRRLPALLRRRTLGADPARALPPRRAAHAARCRSRRTASTRCASRSASPRRARCRSPSGTCAGTATSPTGSSTCCGRSCTTRPQRSRVLESYAEPLERARRVGPGERASTLSRLLQLNFETYLLDDLNVKMDRMSMAHALETRSPFLDTALVEFGASLPDRLRMRLGKGKILLRRAMKDAPARVDPRARQDGVRRAARGVVPRRAGRPRERAAARPGESDLRVPPAGAGGRARRAARRRPPPTSARRSGRC